MMQTDGPKKRQVGDPEAFKKAVANAQAGEHIVYSLNTSCRKSPCRLMALGAYEAGLVLLVKKPIGELNEDDGFRIYQHIAIRTKKAYRHFKEADLEEYI